MQSQSASLSPFTSGNSLAAPLNATSGVAAPIDPLSLNRSSSLLFVDSRVADYQQLIAGVQAGTEVHVLNPLEDAVSQITQTLLHREGISSLHIVSHGEADGLQLGTDWLSLANLPQHTEELQSWQQALTRDADILLYGCDVAEGELGQTFVQQLARLTGADVAASNDLTGSAELGGDWELEFNTGSIEAPAAFGVGVDYRHILATFTVTNTNDSGVGSLRQAVLDANAAAGTDTVTFTGVFGDATPDTIVLTTGQLDVTGDTTIAGTGANLLTISGNNASRVFNISAGTVGIDGVTIANGNPGSQGGGIYNNGNLTLTNSTVRNNSGAFGGGIANYGTLAVDNTTLSNNTGSYGGGIYNYFSGGITLTNSIIRGNAATNFEGGGILNYGTLTAIKDTITANSANTQGGGIVNNATATLTNTLIAGNTSATSPDVRGNFTGSNNFIGKSDGSTGITNGTNGNVAGTSAAPISTAPTVTISGTSLAYTENALATLIDATASVSDLDSANFDTGFLSVSYTAGGTVDDRLAIFNQGIAAGQIGVAGNTVTFEGTAIGTFTGGIGTNALVVTFNSASASPTAVSALVQNLTYANVSDTPSTTARTVQFVVTDGDGGISTPVSKTINVTATNDAPTIAAPLSVSVLEDIPSPVTGINFDDLDVGAASVTATFSVVAGTLNAASGGGVIVGGASTIRTLTGTIANINSFIAGSNLTYTTVPNSTSSQTLTASISDNGSTPGPAQTATSSIAIVVTPVNDAPSFNLSSPTVTAIEDAGPQTRPSFATNISSGPSDEAEQTLSFLVTNNNAALFSVQPSIDATGKLSYTPADNANGTATVTASLQDNGPGTAPSVNTSAAQTFTITVNPVNDAPSFVKGADQIVLEDAGSQTVAWATAIASGPANEAGQTLSFQVTNNNMALFSVQPSIDATGNLSYTLAGNANGTATVTAILQDNGLGTAPDVNTSAAQTFTITVNPINDAPSFTKGADQIVLEDAGNQTVAWASAIAPGPANEAGQTLSFQVTNNNTALFSVQPSIDATGKLSYTPADNANGTATVTAILQDSGLGTAPNVNTSAAQTFTIAVTPVNDRPVITATNPPVANEDGGPQTVTGWASLNLGAADEATQTATYSVSNLTNSGLFATAPSIAPNGTLTYTPLANAFGTATFDVTAQDNGGTANNGLDTSLVQTFTIVVNPVNDRPSFTTMSLPAINEDSGIHVIPNWATFNSGAANESQTATYLISNSSNPSLFALTPTIAANGTLSYISAANAFGTATFDVVVRDSGGTANGGLDTSVVQTFTIAVNSVNDAPSFTAGANQLVTAGTGVQTIANWATGFNPGAANEVQTPTYLVTTDRADLFTVQPTIAPDGTLTYTPIAGLATTQIATLTIQVQDSGDTLNGGDNTSDLQRVTIAVTPQIVSLSVTDPNAAEPIPLDTGRYQISRNSITGTAAIRLAIDPSSTATANDYTLTVDQGSVSVSGGIVTVTLPNGINTATLTVTPIDDLFLESDEALTLTVLDDPTYTVSQSNTGTVTIASSDDTSVDFNGDGKADLVWRNQANGNNEIWLMDGKTRLAVVPLPVIRDTNWEVAGLADFNGDGSSDILWRNQANGGNTLWLLNGTTLIADPVLPALSDLNWTIAGVGDFNQDGSSDLFWRNQANGGNEIWLLNGGQLSAIARLPEILDVNWQVAGLADFNGDGNLDILWHNRFNGGNTLWQMDGTTLAADPILPALSDLNWHIEGVGDLDGDGKADLVWRNQANGSNEIWRMAGSTIAGIVALPIVRDTNWEVIDLSDLNGDGKLDLVWRNRANLHNTLWQMNGTSLAADYELADVRDDFNWKVESSYRRYQ